MDTILGYSQLLNFLEACEKRSFSKASEARFISQQGLSNSIQQLEEQLGVTLFERSPKGITLTEFGEALQSAARPYINQHDQIVETITQLKQQKQYRVSVGIMAGFYSIFPANFFKDFILRHPDNDLRIMTFTDDVCQKSILEKNIHIGFLGNPFDTSQLESVWHKRGKLFLIAGKGLHLAHRHSLKLEELRNESLVTVTGDGYATSTIINLCIKGGVKPSVLLNVHEADLIHELCATNKMIGLWTGSMDRISDLVPIDIEDIDLHWEYHIVVNKHTFITNAEKAFIEYAKEKLEGQ
ncbi:MAG: LysR family transcriptional regulator [Treponema sp.]|jgi:DNA-binding transcriptional LysR family regulator|nr:LysR family transcriptional regulator [Treponema sp.]